MTQHEGDVVLVRHGATTWSASGRHTGRTDIPLTDEGRREAVLVGRALAGQVFERVYASPLSRARDTCVLAGFGSQMVLRDELLERDYGEVDGLTTAGIRERIPGWSVWTAPLPGGETVESVGDRCDRIIADLREVGGRSAVFGHGHCLRVLAARWIGLPALDARLIELDAASISVLGYEHDQAVIRLWNSTQHLESPAR
jgi:probable phosphoglycerate mutase